MEITINKAIKTKHLAEETKLVLDKARDTAEYGITHFSFQSPRNRLFDTWELIDMVQKVSNGTVTHAYNSGGLSVFKIKVV